MASKRQIRANRRNARRSTGPKSAAGKAASAANALRHGLAAADTVVLPDEDEEAFERLKQDVLADLDPQDTLQAVLAQRIVVLLWRLDRAARLEVELFVHGGLDAHRDRLCAVPRRAAVRVALSRSSEGGDGEDADGLSRAMGELDRATDAVDNEIRMQAPSAKIMVEREASARAFDRLARYEGTLQRALHRTLEEFRRLRREAAAEPDAAAEAAPPGAAAASSTEPPRDAGPPAPCEGAAQARHGGRPPAPCGAGAPVAENDFLQNEANSAQTLEAAPCSPTITDSPEAPPTDQLVF